MTVGLGYADRQDATVGLAWTMGIHALLVGGLLFATRPSLRQATAYAVNLVAAPAPTTAPRAAPEAPPRPVERTAPVDPPKRTAKPAPPPTKTTPQRKTEAPVRTANPVTPMPGETPSTGSDVANVSTPGVEFPFPEYLRKVVNEIYKRWQRPIGMQNLRTQVEFVILRDGTVQGIRIVNRSRNYSFDLGAQGAVEAAGNAGAFGPLPEGFRGEALAIAFWFMPRGTP